MKLIPIHIDLGEITVNQKYTIGFKHPPSASIKDVEIKHSCGCTSSRWNHKDTIFVTYTSGKIPVHLEKKGIRSIRINKKVVARFIFDNNTSEEVIYTFSATKIAP